MGSGAMAAHEQSFLARRNMNSKITPGRVLAAATVLLAAWIVHGFLQAMLAACVISVASWPLYARFAAGLARPLGRTLPAALFTCAVAAFVLAPGVVASWALVGEVHTLLHGISVSDAKGFAVPGWLASTPVVGPALAGRWRAELAHPGALAVLTQRAEGAAVLGWAQSLGQFTARHALLVVFTILLLFFLYGEGAALARALTRALRQAIGDSAHGYIDVATRAVRASVNGMLVVGVFDALATALAYAALGAPRPLVWAAITGAFAAVPFLGYAAVLALAVELAVQDASSVATACLLLGSFVLLCGDKFVRPLVARGGIRLPFVWVLMGCIGGFEALGLAGVVVGPVVLAVVSEIWQRKVRELAATRADTP
jgi:predicted PurR-regulated permease PerM